MKRREFLQRTGWFVVGASLLGAGCSDDGNQMTGPPDGGPQPEPKGTYSFPQGVASGDPRADSVVLWTRVVRNADNATDVHVRVPGAFDDAYSETSLVADRIVTAPAASDHAIRVLVTNLTAGKA